MKYCAAVKLLVAGIFCGGGALAGSYTFTTVSDPNAAAGETFAYGINDAGQVSGTYVDSSGYSHGFIDNGGIFTTIDAPNTLPGSTSVRGISNSGLVVGSFNSSATGYGSFIYSGGSFTDLSVPGAIETTAEGINDAGQVVGFYQASGVTHGFLYSGGVYTTLDAPGKGGAPGDKTYAFGISDSGQVAAWSDQQFSCCAEAYVYSSGTWTLLAVPNSASGAVVYGVNDNGQVVGFNDTTNQPFVETAGEYLQLTDSNFFGVAPYAIFFRSCAVRYQ